MKPMKFSSKSWHWRLATVYGDLYKYEDTYNFCEYLRECFKGLFFVFLVILGGTCAGIVVLDTLIFSYVCIITSGFIEPSPMAAMGLVILTLLILVIAWARLVGWAKRQIQDYQSRDWYTNPEPKPDSFFKAAYLKFKEKTCFTIEVDRNG